MRIKKVFFYYIFLVLFSFSSTLFAVDVTVGFGYSKPPFVFAQSEKDTNENRGIELKIMSEALAYRNHTMKSKYISKNKLLTQLQSGIVDASSALSTSESQHNIYYSDEFVYFWNYAVTQPDDTNTISSLNDLEGRKVLAWESATKDLGPKFKKATSKMAFYRGVANQEEQVLLFLEKRADTLVIDWNVFSYFALKYGYDPTKYHQYNIFGGKTGYKVGFRDAALRDDFNAGLAHLKSSGRYDEIYDKIWTVSDKVSLSKEEQTYIALKGSLRLCFDPDWMPYEGKTKDGMLDGMSSDYLALLSHKTGFDITLRPTYNWSDSLLAIKKRQCDLIIMATSTKERKAYLDFTTPYLSFPYVVVTQSKQDFVDDFEKVINHKYAVLKDYASVSDLKRNYPSLDLVEVKNISEGLHKVKSGEVFGFIDSTATVSRVIQAEGLDLKISAKLPIGYELAIATRNDEVFLHSIFQKAVDSITPEDKQRIENKWLAINIQRITDYSLAYKVLFGSIVFMILILYWYKNLKKAHKRTQHALWLLQKAKKNLKQLNFNLEKRVEEELAKRMKFEKELSQKSRLESMGEMIDNIAHQWRQPLMNINAILLNIDRMYELGKLDASYLEDTLKEATDLTAHMSQTIEDFRNFFRKDRDKELVHMNEIMTYSCNLLSSVLKDITICLDSAENLKILVYKNELIQVIVSILSNSIDVLMQRDIGKKKIFVSVVDYNDEIRIIIEDNGGGIADEHIDRIFEPYYTTKHKFGGSGLGLYICKMIIEEHMHGFISVENTTNGAKFIIILKKEFSWEQI
ncbi:MAG: transporter substrate-binding domain-containing protein [Sulfuricurvum sp.]|uniref:transporter substrate-binding domain-containing protein n=1 Tax=Sulfuricurvum sp. TaxID=2025608 RepID=UPI00262629E3|nr:transporter substrate-binding domain-containing protein [Sulfuricurvum sp.]MDD2830474.1 transporter substrate-binding domain-containing protein [Sulfuricurvum sp.]MDD4948597.1 transporter substrate-binding domain-containing protein [Sulfuricurvum sp.]